jgi:predicted metal-binding membrane protein
MIEARALLRPALLPVFLAVVVAWVVLAVAPMSNFWVMWLAMAVAMMIPSATRPLARAASGSAARGLIFSFGYVAVWAAAGIPALLILRAVTWTPTWIAVSWIVAGAYQLTPVMRRHLTACAAISFHGDPLRYGFRQGLRCAIACGPLMVAVSVTAMAVPQLWLALVILVVMTAFICWEKRSSTTVRARVVSGVAMLMIAGVAWAVAGNGAVAPHGMPGMSISSH